MLGQLLASHGLVSKNKAGYIWRAVLIFSLACKKKWSCLVFSVRPTTGFTLVSKQKQSRINLKNWLLDIWFTWKMWYCLMISLRLALRVSVCGRNFNVATFSEIVNMLNVKLCMMVVLIELYPLIPLSVTLIVFQGHSSVKHFWLKMLCSYLIKLKLCLITDYVK